MRTIAILASLLLAMPVLATCPKAETVSHEPDPPTVSLARTDAFNETAILVRTAEPVCLALLELVAQGTGIPHASLQGPTQTRVAVGRPTGAGYRRFTFLVDAWLPAGETRYTVWFPIGPWYLALDPQLTLWFRDGTAARAARIADGTIGAPKPAERRAPTRTRSGAGKRVRTGRPSAVPRKKTRKRR